MISLGRYAAITITTGLILAASAAAQNYSIPSHTLDGGGGTVTGGTMTLTG